MPTRITGFKIVGQLGFKMVGDQRITVEIITTFVFALHRLCRNMFGRPKRGLVFGAIEQFIAGTANGNTRDLNLWCTSALGHATSPSRQAHDQKQKEKECEPIH
ncbi:hypothetical protein D3C86_1786280 [compost metagenome]